MLLWILPACFRIRVRVSHALWMVFPVPFRFPSKCPLAVRTPEDESPGLGSSAFARRYLRNHCYFLFLRLLRCFSSPGSLRTAMDSLYGDVQRTPGFPIQISADQCVFATPRSFSQLITSFFGSQCQGIHPALLLAKIMSFDPLSRIASFSK